MAVGTSHALWVSNRKSKRRLIAACDQTLSRWARPVSEPLERRVLLSADNWTGAAGDGLWNTAGNWSEGTVPGTGDDVTINIPSSSTVVLNGSPSQVKSLTLQGGTLWIQGGRNGFGNASLNVAGNITNDGTLLLDSIDNGNDSDLTVGGTLTNESDGTLQFNNDAGGNRNIDGTLVNLGTVNITANTGVYDSQSSWTQSGGTMTVASSAFLRMASGNFAFTGGAINGDVYFYQESVTDNGPGTDDPTLVFLNSDTLSGAISNGQTVWIQGGRNGYGNAVLTMTGNVTNDGTLLFDSIDNGNDSDLTIGGTLTNESDGTLQFNNDAGGNRNISGSIENLGTVNVTASTAVYFSPGSWTQAGGTITTDPTAFFRADSGTFAFTGGAINGDVYFYQESVTDNGLGTDDPTLVFLNSDTLSGAISTGQTVWIQGGRNGYGNAVLTTSGNVTNDGTLLLQSIDNGNDSDLNISGTLTNAASIDSYDGAAGARNMTGNLVNQGLIDATGYGLSIYGNYIEAGGTLGGGNITFQSVTLSETQSPATPQTLTLAATTTLATGNLANMTLTVLGGASGNGALDLATASNDGTIVLQTINGGYTDSVNISGTLTNNSDGTIQVDPGAGGPRYIYGNVNNLGTVGVQSGITLQVIESVSTSFTQTSGTITTASGGATLIESGAFNFNGGTVGGGVDLLNDAVTIASNATGSAEFILQGSNTLVGTIAAAQTVWLQGGGNGNSSLLIAGTVTNDGTILMQSINGGYAEVLNLAGTLTNVGTIQSYNGAGGPRTITGNLVNEGLIDATGYGVNIYGNYVEAGGTLGGGSIVFESVTVTESASPATPQTLVLDGTTTLASGNMPGVTLWIQGGGNGNGTLDVGTESNDGTILLQTINGGYTETVNIGGTFTNNSDGTIQVTSGAGGPRYIDGDLVNEGALDIDNTGLSISNGSLAFVNSGSINSTGGSLSVASGQFTNSGVVNLTAGNSLSVSGNFNQTSGGIISESLSGTAGFGQLNVGGTAALGGEIMVSETGGFVPVTGNLFNFFTFNSSTGTFSSESGLTVNSSVSFIVDYDPNGVTLQAVHTAVTANSWSGGGDGVSWSDPKNWYSGVVPGPTTDVIIDVPTNLVVNITGAQSCHSLVTYDAISFANGASLTIGTTAQLNNYLYLNGGTLDGGTWSGAGNVITGNGNGTISGLTLAMNLTVANGTPLYVTDGLTLANSTLALASIGNGANLYFLGSQTLAGTGLLDFAGTQSNNGVYAVGGNSPATAATLTIGSGITVSGPEGGVIGNYYAADSIANQGTVEATAPGQTITLKFSNNQTPENTGTLEAIGGGILALDSLQNPSNGTISATNGGVLNFAGNWANAGTITSVDSTVNLGGTFTSASVGTFNRTAGVVDITGLLNNTGSTLSLSTATGPWNLAGGTIEGGEVTSSATESVFTSGQSGSNALNLDATYGIVQTPNLAGYFSGTSETIELWFRADQAGVIVDELGGVGAAIYSSWHDSAIEILANGQVEARVWDLPGFDLGAASFGTWNYVALQYSQATQTVSGFLNGVESPNTVSGNRNAPYNNGYGISYAFGLPDGTNLGSGAAPGGAIQDVSIWNVARSNQQVMSDYLDGVTPSTPGLVADYPMNQTQGDVAIDQSGNGNNFLVAAVSPLNVTGSGTLIGVTLNTSTTVEPGTNLDVQNGLTLNSADVTLTGNMYFQGTQELGGTGQISFGSSTSSTGIFSLGGNTPATAATLTIGPNVTINGFSGGTIGGNYSQDSLINDGTIDAGTSGSTITVSVSAPGTFQNQGALEATSGGTLTMNANWTSSSGSVTETNSTLNLGGVFGAASLGTLTSSGGEVNITGTMNLLAVTPGEVQVTGVVGGAIVNWQDNASVNSGYIVERSSNGVNFSPIGTVGAGVDYYYDSGLTVGQTYYYRVQAYNSIGDSAFSNVASAAIPATQTNGLLGQYFNGNSFLGEPFLTRVDPTINYGFGYYSLSVVDFPAGGIVPTSNFCVIWTGEVVAQYSETYTFYTESDDGIALTVGGQALVNNLSYHGDTENSGTIALTAGQAYPVEIEYFQGSGPYLAQLLWSSPSTPKELIPASQLLTPTGASLPANVAGPSVTPGGSSTLALTAATGSINLLGGTIAGGTVTSTGGAQLVVQSGELDGVTLGTNLTINNNIALTVDDGLTLSGSTLTLASTGNTSAVYFDGSQTLGGTGDVQFAGTYPYNDVYAVGGNAPNSAAALTLAPGITVTANQSGTIGGYYSQDSLLNQGTIDVSGPSASLNVYGVQNASAASITINSGGTLGLYNNWANSGSIASVNSTVNLGGTFAFCSVSTFSRTGGTVNLTGDVNVQSVAPSLLQAQGIVGGAILTWQDDSTLISGFVIERSTDGVNFTQVGTVGAGADQYYDSGLTVGKTYYYRVQSYNTVGNSPWSPAASVVVPATQSNGLLGQYFNGDSFSGLPFLTQVDPTINFQFGYSTTYNPGPFDPGVPSQNFSVVWLGEVIAQYSETYTFYTESDDGVQLTVNGQVLISNLTGHGATENSNTIALTAGQTYPIELQYFQANATALAQLVWSSPSTPKELIPASQLLTPTGASLPANSPGPAVTQNGSGTLALNATTGSWNLAGGEVSGGVISLSGGAQLADSNGTLDGVTLDSNLTVPNDTGLSVEDGLTLNNADLILDSLGSGAGVTFSGTQEISGTGDILLDGTSGGFDTIFISAGGQTSGTLAIGPNITVIGNRSTLIGAQDTTDLLVNEGTIQAESGGFILIGGTDATGNFDAGFVNYGALEANGGGTLSIIGPLTVNGQGFLSSAPSSPVFTDGNLLGNTTNASAWNLQGALTFDGSGTAASPELLEAMSQDEGAVPAGFENNFDYSQIDLSNNTYVSLVDESQNATSGANALYAGSLSVPVGSTLNLNGLNLYTLSLSGAGSIINGTVTVLSTSAFPDLSPQNITAAANSNGVVNVAWDDVNSGGGNVTTSFTDQVQLIDVTDGNTVLATATAFYNVTNSGPITSGGAAAEQVSFNLPSYPAFHIGDTLQAVIDVDVNGNVAETNKANNTATVPVTLAAIPDLQVTGLSVTGTSSGKVTVNWDDFNAGPGIVSQNFTDGILVTDATTGVTIFSGTLADNAGANNIGSGALVALSTSFQLPTGFNVAHDLTVTVTDDINDNIFESNKSNNSASLTTTGPLAQYPDLQVQSLTISPTNIQSGQQITIDWNDANTGGGLASGPWQDQIEILNTTTGSLIFNSIQTYSNISVAVGSSAAQTLNATLPNGPAGVGSLEVIVTVNSSDSVFEYNSSGTAYSNNSANTTVSTTLAAYPDLQVTNLAVTPQSPESGELLTINWDDANTGNGAANGPWTDAIEVLNTTTDSVLLNTTQTYSTIHVAPGGFAAESYGFTLPSGAAGVGQLEIILTVNSTGSVYEYNSSGTAQTNNTASTDVTSTVFTAPTVDVFLKSIAPVEDQQFAGPIATFTDSSSAAPYSALIYWGDGGTTAGSIVNVGGTLTIYGTYTYEQAASFGMIVNVFDSDQGTGQARQSVFVAGYTATVSTTSTSVPIGQSISISGSATFTMNAVGAAADVPVDVYVLINGFLLNTIQVTTDSMGNYLASYTPQQAGTFTLAASVPSVPNYVGQAQFTTVGISAQPTTPQSVIPGTPVSGSLTIFNLGTTTLTSLAATVTGNAANLGVQISIADTTLSGSGSDVIDYTLTATNSSVLSQDLAFNITTAQGATISVPLAVSVTPDVPILASNPTSLNVGMVVGQQTLVTFQITNTGGAPTGELTISLPNATYLSLSTPNPSDPTIPSLAPGASASITLELSPASNMTLAEYPGSLEISNSNVSLSVPFTFTAISNESGDVQVNVTDNLTPLVANATVQLLDPYNNTTVDATGTTNSQGFVDLGDVPAGQYLLQASAQNHTTIQETISVIPGITNTENVDLPQTLVQYQWVVTPVPFTDTYSIQLEATFDTQVPYPVCIMTASALPDIGAGQTGQMSLTFTNHGLIDVNDVEFTVPTDPQYVFTPLISPNSAGVYVVGTLGGQETLTIPINVYNNGNTGTACHLTFNGSYDFETGNTQATNVTEPLLAAIDVPGRVCTLQTIAALPGFGGVYGAGGAAFVGPASIPAIVTPLAVVNAQVSLQLDQTAAVQGTEFVGTLDLTNNESSALTGLGINLSITDANGNPVSGAFFIETPTLTGITAVDGTGMLAADATGMVQYVFIPTNTAAPMNPALYHIGGTITYTDPGTGQQDSTTMVPAGITVYPEAQLQLNYFLQDDVYGSDPFNDREPTSPFDLGVLVSNTGYGTAGNFTLTSSQPQIIDNAKGLLINFAIVGTQVGTMQQSPSLTADFGTILPGESESAEFILTSSLQGDFVSFSGEYTHTSPGGLATSQIASLTTHVLIHSVMTDSSGQFSFLAADQQADITADLPDNLYTDTGQVDPVSIATDDSATTQTTSAGLVATVTATQAAGWSYIEMPDPGAGYVLEEVVRSDGTVINMNNAWQTDRVFDQGQETYDPQFHLLDDNGTGSYTLYYVSDVPTLAVNVVDQYYDAAPFSNITTNVLTPGGGSITDGSVSYTYYLESNLMQLPSAPVGVGSYLVSATFSGDVNFTPATSPEIPFQILPAPLSIFANNEKIPFGAPVTTTGTVTGFAGADSSLVTISFVTSATQDSAPGQYSVTPEINDPDDVLANYMVLTEVGTLTIVQAAPSVTLGTPPPQIVYDGTGDVTDWATVNVTGYAGATAPTGTPTLSFYAGSSASGPTLTAAPVNVGTYTVVANYPGDANYLSGQSAPVTFTINPAVDTWTNGGNDGNWADASNWSANIVPNQNYSVSIPAGFNAITVGAGKYSVYSLSSGSSITINGGSLALYGSSFIHGELNIEDGGTLDITNNTLIIDYAGTPDPIAAIQADLRSGDNSGGWNGTGIDSSAVAAADTVSSGPIFSIGYADGADGLVSGVPSGEIEIEPALAGDALLKGTVNFGDFQIMAAHFGQSASWDEGDFNYAGTVNFGDYQLLAANFGRTASLQSNLQTFSVQWTGAADGVNWSNPGNWSDDIVPNQNDAVTIPAGIVGLQLSSTAYSVESLNSGSPIELVYNGQLSVIGSAAVSGGLTIDSGAAFHLGDGSSAGTFTGNIVDNGSLIIDLPTSTALASNLTGSGTVTLSGAGAITFSGNNAYTGTTTINHGTLIIGAAGAFPAGGAVVNNSALAVQAGTSATPVVLGNLSGNGSLSIGAAGSPAFARLAPSSGQSNQSGLTIANGSGLDLTNNTFYVDYGTSPDPIGSIASYLGIGYSNGWRTGGIFSSAVAAENASETQTLYALGYADGADKVVNSLSSGQIEIMPALAGDASLRGSVSFGDYQILAAGFGKSGGWDEGNFTYGSAVNFGDYQELAANFGKTASLPAAAPSDPEAGSLADSFDDILDGGFSASTEEGPFQFSDGRLDLAS